MYLHAHPDATGLPLVLTALGSGIYTSVDTLLPVEEAVEAGRVALLTLDKPGLTPDPEDPAEVRIDDAAYDDYTRADLVDCAAAAIAWARAAPAVAPTGPLVLFGHSEGTLVVLSLLDRLHATAPAEAERVRGLLLSGTPTRDLRSTLEDQVGTGGARRLEARARGGDDATVRAATDVGAGTMADLIDAPGYEALLGALAARGVTTPITLFHGEDDRNCDPEAVRASVGDRWARHHPADRRPLRVGLRRYPDAGHHGSAELVADLALHAEVALLGLGPYAPPTAAADGVVDLPVPAADRARLEGSYGPRKGPVPRVNVVARGDQLVAQPAGQPLLTLLHQGGLRFVADLDPAIAIQFDPDGQLILEQGGGRFVLPRVGPPDPSVAARVAGPAPTPATEAPAP